MCGGVGGVCVGGYVLVHASLCNVFMAHFMDSVVANCIVLNKCHN